MRLSMRMLWPLFLLALGALSGCQSDLEKLADHCEAMEHVVRTERDCDRLAAGLEDLAEEHVEWMQTLEAMSPPDEATQKAYSDALEPCMRARLEAASGACRHHDNVIEALDSMKK